MSRDATVVASTGCVLWLWQANVFWPLHALIIALKTMTKLQLVVATVFNFLNAFGHAVYLTPYALPFILPSQVTRAATAVRWVWTESMNGWVNEYECECECDSSPFGGVICYSNIQSDAEKMKRRHKFDGFVVSNRQADAGVWNIGQTQQTDKQTDRQTDRESKRP